MIITSLVSGLVTIYLLIVPRVIKFIEWCRSKLHRLITVHVTDRSTDLHEFNVIIYCCPYVF